MSGALMPIESEFWKELWCLHDKTTAVNQLNIIYNIKKYPDIRPIKTIPMCYIYTCNMLYNTVSQIGVYFTSKTNRVRLQKERGTECSEEWFD